MFKYRSQYPPEQEKIYSSTINDVSEEIKFVLTERYCFKISPSSCLCVYIHNCFTRKKICT